MGDDRNRDDPTRCGGCQCGAVRYRIDGDPLVLAICHCTQCQRQSGSAFGMSLIVDDTQLEVSGELSSYTRDSELGKPVTGYFCPTCGTRVYHRAQRFEGKTNIKAGTLDDTSALAPVLQSWTETKQPWLELAVEIPAASKQPST